MKKLDITFNLSNRAQQAHSAAAQLAFLRTWNESLCASQCSPMLCVGDKLHTNNLEAEDVDLVVVNRSWTAHPDGPSLYIELDTVL